MLIQSTMETFDETSLSDVEGEEFMDHKFSKSPTELDNEHEDLLKLVIIQPIPTTLCILIPEILELLVCLDPEKVGT